MESPTLERQSNVLRERARGEKRDSWVEIGLQQNFNALSVSVITKTS